MEKLKYKIEIKWSEEDQIYIARVPELDGVVTHGKTPSEALEMAEEAIELHLESLREHGEPIPEAIFAKKFSGKFPIRVSPDLHASAVLRQKKLGLKSLNSYIECLIGLDTNRDIEDVDADKKVLIKKSAMVSKIRSNRADSKRKRVK